MIGIPLESVELAITRYSERFRAGQYISTLVLSDWYSLFPDELPDTKTRYNWPDDYPDKGKPGVYFFFDSEQLLLYIGETSGDLQRRLGDHVTWANNRSGPCKVLEKKKGKPWRTRPCYVRTLAVQDSSEALPLEEFLIDELQPPENTKGIRARP